MREQCVERFEKLYTNEINPDQNLFYSGPAEFLVSTIAKELEKVTQFKALFDTSIDCYKRMDYSVRELPAIRLYVLRYTKEFDSWFINGDVTADIIFPASLRRDELQQFQSTISSAIIQQFRRTSFFNAVTAAVPGLNELGKRVDADMTLGFEWQDEVVPLTQITLNFRIDLRAWDEHLTQTNRTKEDPFCETIVDLDRIVATICALKDDKTLETEVKSDQEV